MRNWVLLLCLLRFDCEQIQSLKVLLVELDPILSQVDHLVLVLVVCEVLASRLFLVLSQLVLTHLFAANGVS